MGVTVRQKIRGKNKPWCVFIHGHGPIQSRSIGTKRDAEAFAVRLRGRLALGEHGVESREQQMPEFSTYAERYYETHAKTMLKRNTCLGYRTILDKHLNPAF